MPGSIFSGLFALRTLNLSYNRLESLPADVFSDLSVLGSLALSSNRLGNLPSSIFSGVSSLSWLSLSFNELSQLPMGLFSGLTSVRSLYLGDNTVELSVTVLLERIGENEFRARVPAGAPFTIVLPISITNGSIEGRVNTTITIPAGGIESEPLTVTRAAGVVEPMTLNIDTLPEVPRGHYGYDLVESSHPGDNDVSIVFALGVPFQGYDPNVNHAPVFVEGNGTIRSVEENTVAGVNIGSPVVATDEDDDPLTYGLEGPDAAAFGIVGSTGQLQTRAPLDYESRDAYAVTVIVTDGRGGADTIGVTISVTDANEPPIFTEGARTTRSVGEHARVGTNVGAPVFATDEDSDPLIYTLSGVDTGSFSIVGTTGQLQTRTALDYETQNAYSVTVLVSDGKGGTDTIGVAISVSDAEEDVPDPEPVVEEILVPPPTYEPDANHAPVFTEGSRTTRSIAENTLAGVNIGAPVVATDEDGDPLTYRLQGTDAPAFGIVATTGQLRTRARLDYETRYTYAVTVMVSDGRGGADTIGVTISVTDVNEPPIFTEGEQTTRSIAENTTVGANIGASVVATDEDNDPLTYTIGGTDAAAFGILGTTGQLQTRTPLDYETKDTYAVVVTVSDDEGETDTIRVTINVTDEAEDVPDPEPVVEETIVPPVETTPNRDPAFANDRATRSIAENTDAGTNIGAPVSATDADGDTLTYTLGGIDASSFTIAGTTGQLKTRAPLDYETKNAYIVIVTVSDGSRTDTITVIITVIDVDETTFGGGRETRSIAENTPAGVNIGLPVSATNVDSEDVLIYSLEGPDAAAFTIIGTTGQLQTRAPLDYETKNTYTLTVIVTDGTLTASITVNITVIDVDESAPPVPTQGEVTISEIMYSAEAQHTAPQWIELHNSGTYPISLRGWTIAIQNIVLPEVPHQGFHPQPPNIPFFAEIPNLTFTFQDLTFDNAPTLFPNETVLVVTDSEPHTTGLTDEQIYNLDFEAGILRGFNQKILSVDAFSIKLIDLAGNLVDEVGNFDGDTQLWQFGLGHRGKTRDGHRSSIIRRYVNGLALDGTKQESWIPAVNANLTPDQRTYYGDRTDISSPGIGIVVNTIIPIDLTKYDVNQDGTVDNADLEIIAARLGQSGPNSADVNDDGVVNNQDLVEAAGVIAQLGAAAPALLNTALHKFTAADIQAWLTEAQGLDLTDPKIQNGIRFLEQLLAVLTPKATALLPNYPNPFNPETWIPYRLAKDAVVTVTIYDPAGRVVRRLDVGHRGAAFYESRGEAIYWDGRNEVGDRVASGVYFYTLTAGEYAATRKMVILK